MTQIEALAADATAMGERLQAMRRLMIAEAKALAACQAAKAAAARAKAAGGKSGGAGGPKAPRPTSASWWNSDTWSQQTSPSQANYGGQGSSPQITGVLNIGDLTKMTIGEQFGAPFGEIPEGPGQNAARIAEGLPPVEKDQGTGPSGELPSSVPGDVGGAGFIPTPGHAAGGGTGDFGAGSTNFGSGAPSFGSGAPDFGAPLPAWWPGGTDTGTGGAQPDPPPGAPDL